LPPLNIENKYKQGTIMKSETLRGIKYSAIALAVTLAT